MCLLFIASSLSQKPKPTRAASMWVKGTLSKYHTYGSSVIITVMWPRQTF